MESRPKKDTPQDTQTPNGNIHVVALNPTEEQKGEANKDISLAALVGGEGTRSRTYVSTHFDKSLARPLSLFGVGSSTRDEVSISVEEKSVVIKCLSKRGSKVIKEEKFSFPEEHVMNALRTPKQLNSKGERGVSLLTSKHMDNASDGMLLLLPSIFAIISLFGSSSYARITLELIFNGNQLDRMRISQNYHDKEKELFLIKNLCPEEFLLTDSQLRSAHDNSAKEKAQESRKFNF